MSFGASEERVVPDQSLPQQSMRSSADQNHKFRERHGGGGEMDRRDFNKSLAGAALSTTVFRDRPAFRTATGRPEGEGPGVPFKLSVMLWTVFTKQPFEQRLEKVAEAG
jgi:hypothetical protein